jgi:phage-related protein
MLSLSSITKAEKNKMNTDSVMLILLELQVPIDGVDPIRVCYNTEDITWNGQQWIAFPMEIAECEEDSTGSYPSFDIKLDNTGRALTYYVEQSNGANGGLVILRVVNSKNLDSITPEIEEKYEVSECHVDQNFVTLTVGPSYSPDSRRPIYRYLKNGCRFEYKDKRCQCSSSLTDCPHTLAGCRARGNSARFGGFPGIDQGGIYV